MSLRFYSFNLELKDTFTIFHGSRNFQKTLIIELTDGGFSGYGEATATSYYGVSVENMITSLKAIEPIIKKNIHLKPEKLWEITRPYIEDNPFAHCALDMAMHDLDGKRKGLPLHELWGLDIKHIPSTSYTIGIDTVEKMVEKMQNFPWPLYKIKLGTKEDIKILSELRKHTASVFRVDANGAWNASETIENSFKLKELNVELIEQPLPKDNIGDMLEVYQKSALPVIADESCLAESDVLKCHNHFHGINIKLTKCSGITPAKRMISEAKTLGMEVMMGCMTESSVGISAIAQFLPLLDYVDMDGALLLKNDVADGVKIDKENIFFPERNGTGVRLL